jgi:ubiquitin-protein ligase
MVKFETDPAKFGRQRIKLSAFDAIKEFLQVKAVTEKQFKNVSISKEEYFRKYISYVKHWSPDWLDEYEAMANELGVPFREFVLAMAARHAPPAIDCTSWIAMPDVTENGKIILHKNRDGGNAFQSWIIRESPGHFKWTGIVDSLDANPLFGLNERGLAAAMNSGEACKENNAVGLHTPNILRIVLEKAGSAREAVGICREIIERGHYAHGSYGSIFLFADAGQAFITENTAVHFFAAELKSGLDARSNSWHLPGIHAYTVCGKEDEVHSSINRRLKVLDFLKSKSPQITVADCRKLARESEPLNGLPGDAVSREYTTFGISAVPDAEKPQTMSKLSVITGPPEASYAVPMYSGVTQIPRVMADSSMCQLAFKLRKVYKNDAEKMMDFIKVEEKLDFDFDKTANEVHQSAPDKYEKILNDNLTESVAGIFSKMQENYQKSQGEVKRI